jgi:hypothetical protein
MAGSESGGGRNPRVLTADRLAEISVETGNAAYERRAFSIRSNTPEARLKSHAGGLSLFDAVPFLAFPISWPRTLCVIAPEKEQRSRAKK